MHTFEQLTHFAGFDWAKDHHDAVILDRGGHTVLACTFAHTAEGWAHWREMTKACPALGVAIETNQGAAVDQLLQSPVTVYSMHPKAAEGHRDRHGPSGSKTDQADAWCFADALRVDGRHWRPLAPEDPLTEELRLLCREEVALITRRTALVHQIQQALCEHYPAALEAFDDWTTAFTWDFVVAFPTPEALVKAGQRKWEKFLHSHKLWRPGTAEKRLEIFARAAQFCGTAAVTRAKSRLAVSTAKVLQSLQRQLEESRSAIEKLFAQHPDHDLFGSLPGAGDKLAPRLLSAIGTHRPEHPDAPSLQCVAGTAPISDVSGQVRRAQIRWHCNRHLRHAVHLWSDCSRKVGAWAQAYYLAQREKGKSHACALRCRGQRWLKILWKMWQSRTCYDEARHALNQQRHGSWVLQLQPKTT